MPFLFPLFGLIAGILLGNQFKLPIWGVIPISVACIVYIYILRKSVKPLAALRLNKSHRVWVLLLFCGIGMIDMAFHQPDEYIADNLNKYILAEGEIKECSSFSTGDRFIVKLSRLIDSNSQVQNCNNFKIILSTDGLSASVGDMVILPANFYPIEDNPNLRATGFADRMNRVGIYYRAYPKENEVIIKGFNNTPTNNALLWRDKLVTKIEKSSLSRSACDFITALLLGDRSFLSAEVRSAFSNAGVAHVLALSGLHVSILMGIILALLFPLKIIGFHKTRYIIALLFLWFYVFFTGMSPSTVRATIMTTFVIAALLLQRRNSAENALLVAIFLILLFNPLAIYDIGLQLSVLCVGSILFFIGQLNPVNRRHHPILHSVTAAVLVSLVATAATWVVISYYFQSIPLLFLPVNLALLPLLPFYIWIAVVYLMLLSCGIDAYILSAILNYGYKCFDWIVGHLSSFGNSTISFKIQFPIMIIWVFGVLILAYSLKMNKEKRKMMVFGSCSLLCLAIVCIPILNRKAPDSIIFQKNYHDISLALYDGEDLHLSTMPRNSISRVFHKGCEVLSIDSEVNIDSLSLIHSKTGGRRGRRRYLILGGGFKGSTLNELPQLKEYDKIILHSSIKRRMENILRQEAADLGIKNIHSLRDDGPLEEFLPDSLPDNM